MSFINGASVIGGTSGGKWLATGLILGSLLLSACASQPEKEPGFDMPASVAADLGTDHRATDKTGDAEKSADPKKETVTDADSADVLARLRTQATPLKARDADHEKQAKAAKPAFDLALVEMKKGNLDTALSQFRQLAQTYPALAGPVINQAIILHKKGQLAAAHKLLQDGLLNHGRNPYYLNQLGIYSREMGQFKKAQASYESALRIDGNYAKAHYNLAVLADLYLHDPALALREFQTYQSLLPEPDKKVAGWIKELERRQAP